VVAGDSWTSGAVKLSVQGAQIESQFPAELRLPMMDEHVLLTGSIAGNTAEAGLLVDLASGSFGQYAGGLAPLANVYGGGTAYVDAQLSFHEGFRFHIPAGTYPDGLSVTYRGLLGGSLHATGTERSGSLDPRRSNVQQTVWLNLGGPYGGDSFSLSRVAYADDNPLSVMTGLDLTVPLLPAQTDLPADLETSLVLSGSLTVRGGAHNFYPYPDESSSFNSDFAHTLKFTEIDAPVGVTWDSASGVFLSVPEPGTGVLLVLGAGGLWAVSAARRRRRP
jgi:hypothetical protein